MTLAVGTKVRCIKEPEDNKYNETLLGREGVVRLDDGNINIPLLVEWTGWCDGRGSAHNEWLVNRNEVEKIKEEAVSEEGIYIVVVKQYGKLAPAAEPRTYKTAKQANKVAEEMAKTHGGKFYAFKATFEATNIVNTRSL
jgi:hypothetical protein